MNNPATITSVNQGLLEKLDPEGKLNLASCLQCARCSAGCTMRLETDILPHQMNRMVLMGMEDELLKSKAIWTCVSCHTCVSRCPMKVDTPALVDKLREMTQTAPSQDLEKINIFNNEMLKSMKQFGRVYELGMMGFYKMRARDLFSDLAKFPTMLLKGKMKIFPPRTRAAKSVSAIFDKVRARRAKR
ncbi:MAG: 4Fe-4S dicluster domain-containing protein [Armatimonadota bacterium]|nr:4Fe-4S dicluster domain-containing protein [bacterium]